MVRRIQFDIPSSSNMDNPIEDAALMARIGAKLISEIGQRTNNIYDNNITWELTNVVTGTKFKFGFNNRIWRLWRC